MSNENPLCIRRIIGTGIALESNDIDTDRIMPARFLKELGFNDLGVNVFADERRQAKDKGRVHPFDEVLRSCARVLVVAKNFCCGSSREHAPQALKRWGISVIIGESFGEIFRGNCASIGLPCLTVGETEAAELRSYVTQNPHGHVDTDLEGKFIVFGDRRIPFTLSEALRERFISGAWNVLNELLDHQEETREIAKSLSYVKHLCERKRITDETDALTTRAAQIIEDGGVVILPADTVYGIYGSAVSEQSIERVYRIKGRKRGKPFGVVSTREKIHDVVCLNKTAAELVERCWPSPVSIIAHKKPGVLPESFSEAEGLLVVCAENAILAGIVEKCRVPIFSTTCNLAGEDEAKTLDDLAPFRPLVDMVVENHSFPFRGTPSSIVNTMGDVPVVIREGAYPVNELTSRVAGVTVDTGLLIQ